MAGWAIAADVAGKVAGGIASGQQARANAEQERRRLAEEQRQFNSKFSEDKRQFNTTAAQRQFDQNTSAQTQYGDRAQGVNRELELLPMRDRAAALLQARMANPAQQVAPRSLAGGTASLQGGTAPQMPFDLNAIREQAQNYKAGDGGMTGDVQRQLLERYMNVPKAPELPQDTSKSPQEIELLILQKDQELQRTPIMGRGPTGKMMPMPMPVGQREQALRLYRAQLEAGK